MEKKLVAILILSGLLLYRILIIFSYNGEVGGIDNNFVFDVVRGIGGMEIYTDPASAPYAVTLYTPLYLNACSAIGRLLHINPDDPIQVYQLCRTVALACDSITCFLLYRLLYRRMGVAKEYSGLAIAGFACIICFLGYTFSRSDCMVLTFYAATIYVLTGTTKKPIRIALLALLSVGCIFSKQNGIILPVVVLTWLWFQKEKKATISYLVAFIVVFGGTLLIYTLIYPHFWSNTVTALQNKIDLSWFYIDIFKRMMNSLWSIPIYIAAVWSTLKWLKPSSATDRSWAAIFIIQLLFSLGISLKFGSTVGYFNESLFLAFIILFRLTTTINAGYRQNLLQKGTVIFLPLLLLFFIHTLAQGYLFFIQNRKEKIAAYEQQKQVRDYLQPRLQDNYALNLAEPNTDFFKVLFYRNIAAPNTDMIICCLMPDKNFDYSGLKQDIANGRIGYLVMREIHTPQTLWGVSLEGFKKDTTINGYTIYRR